MTDELRFVYFTDTHVVAPGIRLRDVDTCQTLGAWSTPSTLCGRARSSWSSAAISSARTSLGEHRGPS
jgi:hypothetical protein